MDIYGILKIIMIESKKVKRFFIKSRNKRGKYQKDIFAVILQTKQKMNNKKVNFERFEKNFFLFFADEFRQKL